MTALVAFCMKVIAKQGIGYGFAMMFLWLFLEERKEKSRLQLRIVRLIQVQGEIAHLKKERR